jgi:signal transduction histidine kinase
VPDRGDDWAAAATAGGDATTPDAVDSPAVLAETLPDGLVVADRDGRVVVFNAAATRITGIPSEAALGKELTDALPLEDLDGRRWWPCIDPYAGLRTRSGHPERSLGLAGGVAADRGSREEVLVTARFVRDRPLGDVTSVVVSLRSARARRREETSRAELVSTVAHELRSPLTSVKGFTSTLLAKWDRFTDAQKRLMLETVEADADRVTRLITELLDTARIDSGRLEIRRQVVNLGDAVTRHIAGMVASGQSPERFVVDVRGSLPELWVDRDKLDQVLANLLENAVRHGAGTVTVTVERVDDDTVGEDATALTVADEGEGVPADLRQRVFTRFWRTGRRGGTGLGLYIVRGLVEAHGGTIYVGQAPQGGGLFRVVLPAGTPDYGI